MTPIESTGRLARLGFRDAEQAGRVLSEAPLLLWDVTTNGATDEHAAVVVAALGRSADPDEALDALHRIAAAAPAPERAALLHALGTRMELRCRLVALLGVSGALGDHLALHPEHWHALLDSWDLDAVDARLADAARQADPVDALRSAHRRDLLAIAGRDLAGDLTLEQVTERLADLADATLRASLHVAGTRVQDADRCRLAVVAMGKTGAREMNYVSDVDVVFVAEPADGADEQQALSAATRLASELMRVCGQAAWQVDANLRPEGRSGPLVRTLGSHRAYYGRWAGTWEFQALLKARPAAGDAELGRDYLQLVTPLVWTAAQRPNFVPDVQAMRRRVVEHLGDIAPREIKLGPGGLRDVEFAVQLLQLVHGRADQSLHVAATLPALRRLAERGFVGQDDAVSLADAYRFLRATEHRLQLRRLRRTHLVPADAGHQAWLARALGFRPDRRGDARAVFTSEWNLHAREVRRLHEKLFYRPLLLAVARVPTDGLRLSPAEAGARLAALGFDDPRSALQHIQALTAGLSRRAALQQALLPVMLAYFSEAPDPDGGLRAYRQVSDALGATPWYLRALRDEGTVAARLAAVLGTSRYATDLLMQAPEALRLLGDDAALEPRPAAELHTSFTEAVLRRADDADAIHVVRSLRRQELLRVALADLTGLASVEQVIEALSGITEAALEAALAVAVRSVTARNGPLPFAFAIVAMGRLGGAEIGYGSDADVMYVYEPLPSAPAGTDPAGLAQEVAGRLRELLGAPSGDPPLTLDANLRPEGRNGPLVRSLASYARYYRSWSSPWEAQALLRARPVAGDAGLGARFVELVDPVRYPVDGVGPADLAEIRRLKGRVDSERLPRGADPTTHTKLGRGGLTDIEWTVQLLQMCHGDRYPSLRTTRTLDALDAAAKDGLLDADDAAALRAAWRGATHVRNAIMLVRDKPDDQLPHQGRVLGAVGRVLGYPPDAAPGEIVDDYRRTARRARRVVERIFYDTA